MAFGTAREHEHLLLVFTGVWLDVWRFAKDRVPDDKANRSQRSYQSDSATTVT
jgi:hypothetical protein